MWGEVKINEARRDLFFDHHVTLWGHFSEVTHKVCSSIYDPHSVTDQRIPGPVSCRCLEPGWFVGDPTPLARDNIMTDGEPYPTACGIIVSENVLHHVNYQEMKTPACRTSRESMGFKTPQTTLTLLPL